MKKNAIVLLSLLLTLWLCACTGSDGTYTVGKGGMTFTVDTVNGTVSDGTHTYEYTFSGDSSSYGVTITYPNGSTYYWARSGNIGHGGWSDDYDEDAYADGDTLCDVIAAGAPAPADPTNWFLVLFLIAVGIFNAAAPETAWYLEYGWRYKDAEPSDAALTAARAGGIFAIFVGVCMIFL